MAGTLWLSFLLAYAQAGTLSEHKAAALVGQAAAIARTANSFIAEGTLVEERGGKIAREQFRIRYQQSPPFRARLEVVGGTASLVRICDGSSQWTYYGSNNNYVRVMLPQIGPCVDPINAWPLLPWTLHDPVLLSKERVPFENGSRQCEAVRGSYIVSSGDTSHRILTLCIDSATGLILRYRIEESAPEHRVRTISFSEIKTDAKLDPGSFQFRAPSGSREVGVINWLDPIARPSGSVFRVSNEVTAPLLTSMFVPEMPAAGLKDHAVIFYVEVNKLGATQNIKVVSSVNPDLDRKAAVAVAKWRFDPAWSEHGPVTVATAIAIDPY